VSAVSAYSDVVWTSAYTASDHSDVIYGTSAVVTGYRDILYANILVVVSAADVVWANQNMVSVAYDTTYRGATYEHAVLAGYAPTGLPGNPVGPPPGGTPSTPTVIQPPDTLTFRHRTAWGVSVIIKNLITGEDRELDNIKEISYQASKNAPVQWTIRLDNANRRYSRFNQASDLYTEDGYSWITPDVFTPPESPTANPPQALRLQRVVIIKIKRGDMVWESPQLVIKTCSYRASPSNGYEVTVEGIDLTELLLAENITMESCFSGPRFAGGNGLWTAHKITRKVLDHVGVPHSELSFTDFSVWKMHLQGSRPLDMLERIWGVVRVIWYWKGNTLYVKNYELKKDGPADVTFTSGFNIKSISASTSSQSLVNIVQIRRDMEAQVFNMEEGTTVGPITVNISPPVYMFNYNFEFRWCKLSEGSIVALFDSNDDFVGAYDKYHPVAKMTFNLSPYATTYGGSHWASSPGGPVAGDTPYWKLNYSGLSRYITLSDWDQAFSIKVVNSTSVDKWGPRYNPDPYEDPMIPNASYAKSLGNKLLEESGRAKDQITLDVLFDPFLEPNTTAKVIDPHLGIDHFFFIESVSWSLPSMSCSVTAVRYTQ